MNLTNIIDDLNRKAIANRIESGGDWLDENDILHCGNCGEALEHRIWSKRPPNVNLEQFEGEQRKRVEVSMRQLKGKKVRCMCRCDINEREKYDKKQKEIERKERQFLAFGNSMQLSKITFATDNGERPQLLSTMERYVNKFGELKAKGACIILSGGHNVGKTFYSIAIANALIDKGYYVSYSSVPKIHSKTSPYVSPQHVINTELFADLVIIEDANEDCLEGKNWQTLNNYIATVQSQNIPIIITTRLGGGELEQIKSICRNASVIKMD